MSDSVKVTQHWCLTEDRSRVVPETDVEARWLLWPTGTEVPVEEARKYGLLKERQPIPRNKARRAGGNK